MTADVKQPYPSQYKLIPVRSILNDNQQIYIFYTSTIYIGFSACIPFFYVILFYICLI